MPTTNIEIVRRCFEDAPEIVTYSDLAAYLYRHSPSVTTDRIADAETERAVDYLLSEGFIETHEDANGENIGFTLAE